MDVRELFVQKVTDVAKVELRQCHIGGGLFYERLEWQNPISDERVPGLDSLLKWLDEREPGSGPTYNVSRTYHLQNLLETSMFTSRQGPRGKRGRLELQGP